MKTFSACRLFFFLLPSAFFLCRASDFRVGAAAVKVTPPTGIPMAGYYNTRLAEGTHDDLQAKAIVFEQDGAKAAVVALDLVSLPRQTVIAARRLIEQSTGLRGDAVMISATHSHTGPLLSLGSVRNSAFGGEMDIAKNYTTSLPQKIAEAVKLAETRLTPAKLSAGSGREDSLPFNRRYELRHAPRHGGRDAVFVGLPVHAGENSWHGEVAGHAHALHHRLRGRHQSRQLRHQGPAERPRGGRANRHRARRRSAEDLHAARAGEDRRATRAKRDREAAVAEARTWRLGKGARIRHANQRRKERAKVS
ncbi:MAG: neutral/alkaline non-lysosomal ceramidase N-terminal domain-containing protein [Verrucomicrobia bacterium]|nr:neutral/alkaline non-lysosomal ceramidase N-terminal domain-containing protein [Verrucomicrobiota bacterium]